MSSSLSSVVSNLVRASMGSSIPPNTQEDEVDRLVAELILKEAKQKALSYSTQGIRAYLPQPESNAPKTNKRFLTSIIRSTDDHNKTILRAQAAAAQDLRMEREEEERKERRARAEEAVAAEKVRRMMGRAAGSWEANWDHGKERERRKRPRSVESDHDDEDRDGRKRRRPRSHRSRSRDGERRSRSPGRRPRDHDSSRRRRHRTRSPDDRRKRSSRDDRHQRSSRRHSRSPSRSRSPRSKRKKRSPSPTTSTKDRPKRTRRSPSAEPELRSKLKSGSSRRDHTPESGSTTGKRPRSPKDNASSSSHTLIGPSTPPPPPPPSNLPSKMDKYFEESYDPRLDIAPLSVPTIPATGLISDAEFEGWDAMLELIKMRREDKLEQKRLERMGISSSSSTAKGKKVEEKWDSIGTGSIMDIEYKKKGVVREWDMGKEGF